MIEIRAAEPGDAETVAAMVGLLLAELSGKPADSETLLQSAIQCLERADQYNVFLAYAGSRQCAGILTLSESAAIYAGGRFGVIQEFYVCADMRSMNIGGQLMEAAKTFARTRKWSRIEVGAPDAGRWGRTVSFYKREGFVEIGPRLKWQE